MEKQISLGKGFETGRMGRLVKLVMIYESGGVYEDFFPEHVAELLVAVAATGEWTPYEFELEKLALAGVEITAELKEMRSKRVVRASIFYSGAESPLPKWTPEEWAAFHAIHPDVRVDPKYDRKRPLL